MPKRSFWHMVLTVAIPYFTVGIASIFVTEQPPVFWIAHAITITCVTIVFTCIYIFFVKEKRNGK